MLVTVRFWSTTYKCFDIVTAFRIYLVSHTLNSYLQGVHIIRRLPYECKSYYHSQGIMSWAPVVLGQEYNLSLAHAVVNAAIITFVFKDVSANCPILKNGLRACSHWEKSNC